MEFGKMPLTTIDHICIVVKDIHETIQQYKKIFGLNQWSISSMSPPKLEDTTVRGVSKPFSMKLAFARVGSIKLELIQPLKGESIYKEFLTQKGGGLHHIAPNVVDDLDKAIASFEEFKIGVLQTGRWGNASFAYLNTEEKLGVIIELISRREDSQPKIFNIDGQ